LNDKAKNVIASLAILSIILILIFILINRLRKESFEDDVIEILSKLGDESSGFEYDVINKLITKINEINTINDDDFLTYSIDELKKMLITLDTLSKNTKKIPSTEDLSEIYDNYEVVKIKLLNEILKKKGIPPFILPWRGGGDEDLKKKIKELILGINAPLNFLLASGNNPINSEGRIHIYQIFITIGKATEDLIKDIRDTSNDLSDTDKEKLESIIEKKTTHYEALFNFIPLPEKSCKNAPEGFDECCKNFLNEQNVIFFTNAELDESTGVCTLNDTPCPSEDVK
jgi:hypothetical protein